MTIQKLSRLIYENADSEKFEKRRETIRTMASRYEADAETPSWTARDVRSAIGYTNAASVEAALAAMLDQLGLGRERIDNSMCFEFEWSFGVSASLNVSFKRTDESQSIVLANGATVRWSPVIVETSIGWSSMTRDYATAQQSIALYSEVVALAGKIDAVFSRQRFLSVYDWNLIEEVSAKTSEQVADEKARAEAAREAARLERVAAEAKAAARKARRDARKA